MNEQTKELAMKYAHKMGNSVLYNADYLEEFAELIVKECVNIAYEYDAPKMSGPGMIIANRIESHFGVEE